MTELTQKEWEHVCKEGKGTMTDATSATGLLPTGAAEPSMDWPSRRPDFKPKTTFTVLPTDAASRKGIPIGTGVIDYFPSALAAIAQVSKAGNDQHNPGQPLHHSRGKSTDHADTLIRHFLERGQIDTDGQRHSAKMAWRALAILQEEMELNGAPLARGAKV